MGGEEIMSDANQIKILSGGAMKSLMVEVVPLFERASGAKVDIRFALTSVLQKEIEQGSFAGFKDAAPGAELNGFFTKDRAAR